MPACLPPPYCCPSQIAEVAADFTVPGNAHTATVAVTNTTHLYPGEGIEIAGRYLVMTRIIDLTTIEVEGTALPGSGVSHVTALDPESGCYQHPVIVAGMVDRGLPIEVAGSDQDCLNPVPGGYAINLALSTPGEFHYAFLGPK